MLKPLLALSLLFAIPAASERAKAPPVAEEIQTMKLSIRNLEGMVEEHQERLSIHKAENDALRKQVSLLEARIAELEQEKKHLSLSSVSEASGR